jgi:leucine dehydrogenase
MVNGFVNASSSPFASGLHLVEDARTGLVGAIAIDSTTLGPAAGGCRFWSYDSHADLHADALRLARGMTYKNAMAGLPFGGGKAVIQRPAGPFDRVALFEAFGEVVADLKGAYITAEDVGTTVDDMHAIRRSTQYVAGMDANAGQAGGDPSPWTARGVFDAMRTGARIALGAELSDLRVAIQGAGNVGSRLCELLTGVGARVFVSDVDPARCARLVDAHGAEVMAPDAILSAEADVFAPCALGGALQENSLDGLKAKLVCGGANNQIATEAVADRLLDLGITYVPDYVANAGGIINVAAEYLGETSEQVAERIGRISGRVEDILLRAASEGRSPAFIADDMAREILNSGRLAA